tara:strand:- start:200 stop:1033 length:834 start_codon:yes stop_codon:yes gene_type:complete
MSYVYILKSKKYPNAVKIGETDREVATRVGEINDDNYGLPGHEGASDWEVVRVIEVENNEQAEAFLHAHYADQRITGRRELFETDDPEAFAAEAAQLVDGTQVTAEMIEYSDLMGPLSIAAIGAGLVFTLKTFNPDGKSTKEMKAFMTRWKVTAQRRYDNAETDAGKLFYGGLNELFKLNSAIGTGVAEIASEIFLDRSYRPKEIKKLISEPKTEPTKNKSKYVTRSAYEELQKNKKNIEEQRCIYGHKAVKRQNRTNKKWFWGCEKFPKCKWTKSI